MFDSLPISTFNRNLTASYIKLTASEHHSNAFFDCSSIPCRNPYTIPLVCYKSVTHGDAQYSINFSNCYTILLGIFQVLLHLFQETPCISRYKIPLTSFKPVTYALCASISFYTILLLYFKFDTS